MNAIEETLKLEISQKKKKLKQLSGKEVLNVQKTSLQEVVQRVSPYLIDLIRLASKVPKKSEDSIELEARLGRFDRVKNAFVPGVSKEFMDSCIGIFTSWDGWAPLPRFKNGTEKSAKHSWRHMVDTFYQVPSTSSSDSITIRTTTTFDGDEPNFIHCRKDKLAYVDLVSEANEDLPSYSLDNVYDVRVAASKEHPIHPSALPPSVHITTPVFTRKKLRRSFFYKPLGASKAFWRFDFTISWEGKTLIEADRNQAEDKNTRYEIEVECCDPQSYLQNVEKGAPYLAASLLLKVKKDLLERGSKRKDVFFRAIQSRTFVEV